MELVNNLDRGKLGVPGLPFYLCDKVIKGFGRGSKQLGIPTANLPIEKYEHLLEKFPVGVYFGWASVSKGQVFPMAMSVGWNPFFKNTKKTIEIHIIHHFETDFYDEELRAIAVGYIRSELDFKFQLDALVKAIHDDIDWAKEHVEKPEFKSFASAIV